MCLADKNFAKLSESDGTKRRNFGFCVGSCGCPGIGVSEPRVCPFVSACFRPE